jgi:hypothetical protein
MIVNSRLAIQHPAQAPYRAFFFALAQAYDNNQVARHQNANINIYSEIKDTHVCEK